MDIDPEGYDEYRYYDESPGRWLDVPDEYYDDEWFIQPEDDERPYEEEWIPMRRRPTARNRRVQAGR